MYRSLLLTLLSLFIGLGSVVAQTGEAAEIYIYRDLSKAYNRYYFEIVMNNNRISNISNNEVLKYTVWSEGDILLETAGTKQILKIEKGNRYFIKLHLSKSSFQLSNVTNEEGEAYLANKENYSKIISLTEDIRNPIATLTKDKLEAGPKNGTGFLLSAEGYIVTNYHVVNNATSINVKGINGDYYTLHSADVLLSDKNNDLAIIKLKNPNITFTQPPFAIKTEVASTGEDIYLLGYPLTGSMGEEVKLTTGVISSKTGYQGDIGSYQVSAAAQPGNSGGPLFDKQGNLIGIINAKINEAENVTYAIKSAYLKTLLELSGQQVTLPTVNALTGLSLSDQVKKLNSYVYIIEVNR